MVSVFTDFFELINIINVGSSPESVTFLLLFVFLLFYLLIVCLFVFVPSLVFRIYSTHARWVKTLRMNESNLLDVLILQPCSLSPQYLGPRYADLNCSPSRPAAFP